MPSPFVPRSFLAFVVLLALLAVAVQFGAITVVFDKLGLSPLSAFALLGVSLVGSAVNLPVAYLRAETPVLPTPSAEPLWPRLLRHPARQFRGRTLLAVNVGGCVIPALFSIYLWRHSGLASLELFVGVGTVAFLSYIASRPIPGIGIGMPILLAPVAAALVALALNPAQSAPLAYISGTLGVLIGADLLHLPEIRRLGAPRAAIGGAGTFDGIFMTGILAVLLA
ncbi:MAG: DUF1614 domain-containing protein [Pseudomonadota bacterium]|nr:MAG: DUF1614 domain-containing protein [Pseudomonadota bacterium]